MGILCLKKSSYQCKWEFQRPRVNFQNPQLREENRTFFEVFFANQKNNFKNHRRYIDFWVRRKLVFFGSSFRAFWCQ